MFKWMTKGPAILVQTTILNTNFIYTCGVPKTLPKTKLASDTQVQMCPAAGDDDGHRAQIVFPDSLATPCPWASGSLRFPTGMEPQKGHEVASFHT
jgi:hypothetical protein